MEKKELMYSDKEIALIKSVFADNEPLLLAIRKLFFGLEMSQAEKDIIKGAFTSAEIIEVFRRKVYSTGRYDTPIGQISDFWFGVEKQVFGASRDTIAQAVESKKLAKAMFEKSFLLLENPDGEKVDVEYIQDAIIDPLQVSIIARNIYMQAIETALLTIKLIAGTKDETLEATVKRLKKDSAK
jgi:hypothetical protein